MKTISALAIAGALGTLARYYVDGFISGRWGRGFPLGTLVINVSGAFLLGLLFTLLTTHYTAPPWLRTALTMGFLGAYTTFSTLSLESLRLFEEHAVVLGLVNLGGSLVLGMAACYLGVVTGRML